MNKLERIQQIISQLDIPILTLETANPNDTYTKCVISTKQRLTIGTKGDTLLTFRLHDDHLQLVCGWTAYEFYPEDPQIIPKIQTVIYQHCPEYNPKETDQIDTRILIELLKQIIFKHPYRLYHDKLYPESTTVYIYQEYRDSHGCLRIADNQLQVYISYINDKSSPMVMEHFQFYLNDPQIIQKLKQAFQV